jgi:hypothetical protein
VTIEGDLDQRMISPRIAQIGDDYYEAAPDESLEGFHRRMRTIAQAQRRDYHHPRLRGQRTAAQGCAAV